MMEGSTSRSHRFQPVAPLPHKSQMIRLSRCLMLLGTTALLVLLSVSSANAKVSFSNDIRPILSNNCFQCHGPDGKSLEADLRFDVRESVIDAEAIVPGDPDKSPMIQHILSDDPDERMPPLKTRKKITPGELKLLRQWITEGAVYESHWSFLPISKPAVPTEKAGGAGNEIDAFIRARLKQEGLKPTEVAKPHALLRRLALDLTGLPPTSEQLARLAKDPAAFDVETIAKELLASPRYGEHMATPWLDAARYADSDGYESDPIRSMWPWRDWVVEAFNRNMPYDQFITEQLAGDLLPNSTLRQKLATGFNRNHRLNNEGGILPEEWLVEYICDRAETTATIFMGLTWGCARCHEHKFDPITQREYYQLYAFFNSIPEKGVGRGTNAPPSIEVPAVAHIEEYQTLLEKRVPAQAQMDALAKTPKFKKSYAAWLKGIGTDAKARKGLPGVLGKTDYKKWDASHKKQAREYFLTKVHASQDVRRELAALDKRIAELRRTGTRVMIMEEMAKARPSYVLKRGAYDQPLDEVTAITPAFLPPMDSSLPKNRLGLARWLTSPNHPLTARVAVNRIWEQFFATGLVKTQEDFGSQGAAPSHPKLLDYLAARFIESGWDVKALQLLIVNSATYQQSSVTTKSLLAIDPENRLLARGPRYRLSAAVIRDQALAASGLLVEQVGGKPVKPYQPDGLWREIIKGRVKYVPDTGDKLYRRSLYTLWRRAVKPPLMELLDSNLRDTCSVSTQRTNTPLQALLLLNDITFVEAARALATRMIKEGGDSEAERLRFGLRAVTGRNANDNELSLLSAELATQRSYFQDHPEAAAKLISTGKSKLDETLDPIELAAFTAVARVLLNLDETISKS